MVYIIRGAEDSVFFLHIHVGYVCVGGVQVIQDGTNGGEAVSNVLMLEGADENFVNSGQNNFSENLVGTIVLVEENRGGVKSIEKFGDSGVSGVGWDDEYRARVDGQDEIGGRQSVVYSG